MGPPATVNRAEEMIGKEEDRGQKTGRSSLEVLEIGLGCVLLIFVCVSCV